MARLLLVALSAALTVASFPPLSWSWLAWVALVPLLAALVHLRPLGAAAAGLGWGVLLALGCGHALPGMLRAYFAWPPGIAWAVFAGVAVAGAGVYFAAAGAWIAWASRRAPAGPLSIAAAWTAVELLRASAPAHDPWAMLGYSQIERPWLRQVADLGGPYALTFLVVAVNAAAAAAFVGRLRGARAWLSAAAVAALCALALGYGAARIHLAPAAGEEVRVAVVQVGRAHSLEEAARGGAADLEDYLRLTRAASAFRPDLVVWPENAVTFYLQEDTPLRSRVLEAGRELDLDLVVGGPFHRYGRRGVRYRNSAFLIRGGRLAGRYDKMRLLPLAEEKTFPILLPRPQAYEPGGSAAALRSRVGLLGTFICFEAMYPEVVRRVAGRARLLVNLSNDAWLGDEAARRHALDHARLRAVESHRWLLRATSTGFSAIIDPWGRIVARGGLDEPAILSAIARPVAVGTFYQRWGDVFAAGCGVWVLLVSALAFVPRRGREGSRLAARSGSG